MVVGARGPRGATAIWEVHKLGPDRPLRARLLQPASMSSAALAARRTDLTGVVIRAVSLGRRGGESYTLEDADDGPIADWDPDGILKQGPRLFDVARQLYNFTVVTRTVHGVLGGPVGGPVGGGPVGRCGGLAGYLQRGDFDVGVQLPVDGADLRCLHYLAYNLVTLRAALAYRIPTRSSSSVDSMVAPFSAGSWAGVFLMFAMMALLLLIADETQIEESSGNLGAWSAALIFGTAGISWGSVHQGVNSTNLISVELATVIGGLSYTTMLTYYQSSVVTALLARDDRPALSGRQLLQHDDYHYKMVSEERGYFERALQRSPDADLRLLYARHLSTTTTTTPSPRTPSSAFVVDLRSGAQMVRDGRSGPVALVADMESVAKQLKLIMTSQELCSVRYTEIDASPLYSAARKDYPPTELLKRGLLLALERGISRRLVRPFRMPCSRTEDGADATATQTAISALTVTAASAALVTLFVGHSLTALILAMEAAAPRLQRRWASRRQPSERRPPRRPRRPRRPQSPVFLATLRPGVGPAEPIRTFRPSFWIM